MPISILVIMCNVDNSSMDCLDQMVMTHSVPLNSETFPLFSLKKSIQFQSAAAIYYHAVIRSVYVETTIHFH